MPIALDPEQTFKYVLESDRGKEKPPAFKFRYLTSREWKKLTRLNDALVDSADGAEAMGKIEDAVRVALVGWENMGGHEYDPAKLEDIINPAEARELLFAIAETIEPTDEDLGKSRSPSLSATAKSAKPARRKNAKTSRTRAKRGKTSSR